MITRLEPAMWFRNNQKTFAFDWVFVCFISRCHFVGTLWKSKKKSPRQSLRKLIWWQDSNTVTSSSAWEQRDTERISTYFLNGCQVAKLGHKIIELFLCCSAFNLKWSISHCACYGPRKIILTRAKVIFSQNYSLY